MATPLDPVRVSSGGNTATVRTLRRDRLFPAGDGEMARLVRHRDWSTTPFGPMEHWPACLRQTLELCLAAPFVSSVLWGADLRIIYNDAYAGKIEHKHPDSLGHPVREVWGEAVWSRFGAAFQNSFATGDNFYAHGVTVDYAFADRVGTSSWEIGCGPIRDETGAIVGLFSQAVEISSLVDAVKASEAARRADELLCRQIVDSAVDYAIISLDLDGHVTRWNKGAERVFGWTEVEMLHHSIDRLFAPEDRQIGRVDDALRMARADGSDHDAHWRIRKDGSRFWAQGKMTPLRDHTGACIGHVNVIRDRTLQRLQTARLRLLARSSEDLLAVERPDDVIDAVLEESIRLLDVDRCVSLTALPGGGFRVTYGADGFVGEAVCDAIMDTGEPILCERIQESSDPATASPRRAGLDTVAAYPVQINGTVIGLLAFGALPGHAFDAEALSFFATLARYISIVLEREERRAALEELNTTLEQRIDDRTRALMIAEENLRQSQKMEAVGQLTSGVAHDFNNLLTGIGGCLELIEARIARGRTDGLATFIDSAMRSATRAAALTHRLLAFSRRQTLDPKPTGVNALIDGMVDLIGRTAGPAIHVSVRPALRLWNAFVDQNQLENVLLNLCINARDAMPDGGEIVIETGNRRLDADTARRYELAPGRYVVIRVGDTGTGMTPEVIARAFDPFFTTKPIGQGTGLGLSMIYGFMRQSGGHVAATSMLGRGTDMLLLLPRHDGPVPQAAPDAAPAARGDPGPAEDRRTILVVDDEPAVRLLATEILDDLGYATLEAFDGPSALRIIRSDAPISLLVTDIGLPGGINGRQLAETARAARPGLAILLITGYAEAAVLSTGLLDTGMQLLTKPFTLDALAARVEDLLS